MELNHPLRAGSPPHRHQCFVRLLRKVRHFGHRDKKKDDTTVRRRSVIMIYPGFGANDQSALCPKHVSQVVVTMLSVGYSLIQGAS